MASRSTSRSSTSSSSIPAEMLANPNDDRWFEDEDVEDEEGSFSEEEEAVDAIMEMLRAEGSLAKDFGMEDASICSIAPTPSFPSIRCESAYDDEPSQTAEDELDLESDQSLSEDCASSTSAGSRMTDTPSRVIITADLGSEDEAEEEEDEAEEDEEVQDDDDETSVCDSELSSGSYVPYDDENDSDFIDVLTDDTEDAEGEEIEDVKDDVAYVETARSQVDDEASEGSPVVFGFLDEDKVNQLVREDEEKEAQEHQKVLENEVSRQPALISEYDYFHASQKTEMRDSQAQEEDDEDLEEEEEDDGSPASEPTPMTSPLPLSGFARQAMLRSAALLPAPSAAFAGPKGVFRHVPILPFTKAQDGGVSGSPSSLAETFASSEIGQQWALFWQWVAVQWTAWQARGFLPPPGPPTNPAWAWPGAVANQEPPFTGQRRPHPPPSASASAQNHNLWAPQGGPGRRYPAAPASVGQYDPAEEAPSGGAANFAPNSGGAPRKFEQYQLQHQQPPARSYNSAAGGGSFEPNGPPSSRNFSGGPQMGPGQASGFKPRFYHNQSQQGAGTGQRSGPAGNDRTMETVRASTYVRQWINSDQQQTTGGPGGYRGAAGKPKPPPYTADAGLEGGEKSMTSGQGPASQGQAAGGGGENSDWYEFDFSSSDLRPSRGGGPAGGVSRGGGGRGGFGVQRGGGRGGFQQRPPIAAGAGGGGAFAGKPAYNY